MLWGTGLREPSLNPLPTLCTQAPPTQHLWACPFVFFSDSEPKLPPMLRGQEWSRLVNPEAVVGALGVIPKEKFQKAENHGSPLGGGRT